jgi:hypothetical protein
MFYFYNNDDLHCKLDDLLHKDYKDSHDVGIWDDILHDIGGLEVDILHDTGGMEDDTGDMANDIGIEGKGDSYPHDGEVGIEFDDIDNHLDNIYGKNLLHNEDKVVGEIRVVNSLCDDRAFDSLREVDYFQMFEMYFVYP